MKKTVQHFFLLCIINIFLGSSVSWTMGPGGTPPGGAPMNRSNNERKDNESKGEQRPFHCPECKEDHCPICHTNPVGSKTDNRCGNKTKTHLLCQECLNGMSKARPDLKHYHPVNCPYCRQSLFCSACRQVRDCIYGRCINGHGFHENCARELQNICPECNNHINSTQEEEEESARQARQQAEQQDRLARQQAEQQDRLANLVANMNQQLSQSRDPIELVRNARISLDDINRYAEERHFEDIIEYISILKMKESLQSNWFGRIVSAWLF